jgi:hypothetical protein
MIGLKVLSESAVPGALALAERYRLLNEPGEAESICLDVLRVDPGNEEALLTMLRALTDQFRDGTASRTMAAAEHAARRLRDEYKRLYYSGLIRERRAKAQIRSERPGTDGHVREWLRDAMSCYEQAEAIRPAGQDEALLRWNACARVLNTLPATGPEIDHWDAVQSE